MPEETPQERKEKVKEVAPEVVPGESEAERAARESKRASLELQLSQEPANPASGHESVLHLPEYLAETFGTTRSAARMEIALGKVLVDGEEVFNDKFDLIREDIRGKKVSVIGESRHFEFTYND